MRILVCVKRVPAPGARINVTKDLMAVDATHLGFAISPHEECAVEAALALVEAHGGEVVVMTAGPPEAEEQLRYSVSCGADRMVLIPTDGGDWDPQRTARVITAAVERLESQEGCFDLVLFGNESADSGGFQVGVRVAVALDRPMINGAKRLELAGPAESVPALRVSRDTATGFEIFSLALPAVVGVKEGINLPRYPTMRGRVASRKAMLETLAVENDHLGTLSLAALYQPPERTSRGVVLGQGPEAAAAVVDVLEELGLL